MAWSVLKKIVFKIIWGQKRVSNLARVANFWATNLKLLSEKARSKNHFKRKVSHGEHFIKCFPIESWGEKEKRFERLEMAFSNILQIFKWRHETNFWKSNTKPWKLLKIKVFQGSSLENGFQANSKSKTNALSVWKLHFQFICKFLSDEVFEWKQGKPLKTLYIMSPLFAAFFAPIYFSSKIFNRIFE